MDDDDGGDDVVDDDSNGDCDGDDDDYRYDELVMSMKLTENRSDVHREKIGC